MCKYIVPTRAACAAEGEEVGRAHATRTRTAQDGHESS